MGCIIPGLSRVGTLLPVCPQPKYEFTSWRPGRAVNPGSDPNPSGNLCIVASQKSLTKEQQKASEESDWYSLPTAMGEL